MPVIDLHLFDDDEWSNGACRKDVEQLEIDEFHKISGKKILKIGAKLTYRGTGRGMGPFPPTAALF